MKAEAIYQWLKKIIEPIHSHDDQMTAIAHWIESEFEDRKPTKGKKKELTKSEEIELLERLAEGNGYWIEYFKADNAAQMITNVRNDHPIELNTSMERVLSLYHKRGLDIDILKHEALGAKNALDQANERIRIMAEMIDEIRDAIITGWHEPALTDPSRFFTWEQIIKAKTNLGIKLTNEETQELIKRAGI